MHKFFCLNVPTCIYHCTMDDAMDISSSAFARYRVSSPCEHGMQPAGKTGQDDPSIVFAGYLVH